MTASIFRSASIPFPAKPPQYDAATPMRHSRDGSPLFCIHSTDDYGQTVQVLFHLTREHTPNSLDLHHGDHLPTSVWLFYAAIKVGASSLPKVFWAIEIYDFLKVG